MERRFKVGYISMNEVSSYGKDFGEALQNSLPEGTEILKEFNETDIDSASLKILLYNPRWKVTPLDRKVGRLIVEIKELEETKPRIVYGH